jgi:archaellum biogenesis ATPase FlaH
MLEPVYFDEQYKRVVVYLKEHSRQYKQLPSVAMVRMKSGVLLDQYGPEGSDERTTEWLLEEIQTFCRYRATELEIIRAAEAIHKDASRETIGQIFKNFQKITEISLEKDLGIEVHRDADKQFDLKDSEIVKPTLYPHFDRVTGGGLPSPGMILFPGTSGLGKSVMLANMGVQFCQQGDFVVYISLELNERRIFQRVCSMMTDVPIRSIRHERDRVTGHLEHRISQGDGLFRIKKMGMTGTTAAHINAYLRELWMKEGVKPSVLLLDYLDLLYPTAQMRDYANIHIRDKFAAEETYSLCEDWNMLCVTASQMVKNNSDMDDFDHASVSGGTAKINTMDYVVALKRKDEKLWMKFLKGRYGGEGAEIPFHWNTETLRITTGTDEEFYAKNPRYNPNYHRETAQKEADSFAANLNRDMRQANKDERAFYQDRVLQEIFESNNRVCDPFGEAL